MWDGKIKHGLAHALGYRVGSLHVGIGQDNHKLLAAKTGHHVITLTSRKGQGSTFTVLVPMVQSDKPVEDFLEDGCEYFGERVEEF